jgi:exodeoxyribonuclease VII small subunit
MATKKPINFEAALQDLTTIVEELEHGELSLELSLARFEKGVGLIRQCQTAIKEAEQKVQILVEQNGEQMLQPYGIQTDEKE